MALQTGMRRSTPSKARMKQEIHTAKEERFSFSEHLQQRGGNTDAAACVLGLIPVRADNPGAEALCAMGE